MVQCRASAFDARIPEFCAVRGAARPTGDESGVNHVSVLAGQAHSPAVVDDRVTPRPIVGELYDGSGQHTESPARPVTNGVDDPGCARVETAVLGLHPTLPRRPGTIPVDRIVDLTLCIRPRLDDQ